MLFYTKNYIHRLKHKYIIYDNLKNRSYKEILNSKS